MSVYDRDGKLSAGKIYNTIVVLESLILLSCSLYGFFEFKLSDPVVSMTLVVGVYVNLYLLFFSISSLKREDSFQMTLSALAHVFLTTISTIHYWSQPAHHPFNTALLIMFCTSALCQFIFLFLTPIVMKSFSYYIFEQVGGDLQLQKMYKQGLIFFAMLKFDAFLSFLLLLLASARLIESFIAEENFYNIASCLYNIIWTVCGYYIVKDEHTKSLYGFCILGIIGQPMYITLKAIQLWKSGYYTDELYPTDAKILFMVVACLWFCSHFFLIAWTLLYVRPNFGQGLVNIWDTSLLDSTRDEAERRKDEQRQQIEALRTKALLAKRQQLHGSGFQYGSVDDNSFSGNVGIQYGSPQNGYSDGV
jgi:hypothetical protein